MRKPLQEFVAAVMVNDCLSDNGAERGHARRQPRRHAPAMERKIGTAGTSCHSPGIRESVQLYHVRQWSQDFRSTMVRNVIEYLRASTAGILCSQTCRQAPDIRYVEEVYAT
jgi:hypothetical protein